MNNEKTSFFWKTIGTHGVMILSTSAGNKVSSRPVSTVVFGGRFYFQTDENYLKYRQIKANPNAAMCCKNISVQGVCTDLGKPKENPDFMRALKRHFPLAAARYSGLESERAIEFTPTLAYRWVYEKGQPFTEYWDFKEGTYKKIKMYDVH